MCRSPLVSPRVLDILDRKMRTAHIGVFLLFLRVSLRPMGFYLGLSSVLDGNNQEYQRGTHKTVQKRAESGRNGRIKQEEQGPLFASFSPILPKKEGHSAQSSHLFPTLGERGVPRVYNPGMVVLRVYHRSV